MSYEDRHDSRKDPTAEVPGVPCGPFNATEAVPFSFVNADWCVMAEGDVYGIKLPNEADAKAWAAALNDAYEAGYASGQSDLINARAALGEVKGGGA